MKETAKTDDYTLVKYRDPETGKLKFRKKRHNDKIVKQQDVEEKAVSKAQQKFFGMVRAKQKGEMPNASPEVKKAAASMSKKDVKDFAATKHKGLPAKKEAAPVIGVAARGVAKVGASIARSAASKMISKDKDQKEGYIGAKGEKGRDYHNAGTFDKNTAYSHAKKHNGVVHKDPSGKYLVKHGKGKHVGEGYRDSFKAAKRSAKYKELSHEYEKEKQVKKRQDFLDRLRGKPPVKKEEKSYFDFVAELTDKQRAEIEKRKAARMKSRGARRGPEKGTKPNTAAKQTQAKKKPLDFVVKSGDHHSSVHKTIAKAADAMHPSLGSDARHVSLNINGKKKVYTKHADLQHVVDYHRRLKDKGQKAQLMKGVRDKGHDHVSKLTGMYRKVTGK